MNSSTFFEQIRAWSPTIAALASCVAAISAAYTAYRTNKNALRTRALDLLNKAEQQWDSERMSKIRVEAAKALLAGNHECYAIDDVLDFIDGVGRMVKENDIGKRHVWESFYHSFSAYLDSTVEARAEARKKDRTIWENAVALRPILAEQQRIKLGIEKPHSPSDLKKFLTDELALQGGSQGPM